MPNVLNITSVESGGPHSLTISICDIQEIFGSDLVGVRVTKDGSKVFCLLAPSSFASYIEKLEVYGVHQESEKVAGLVIGPRGCAFSARCDQGVVSYTVAEYSSMSGLLDFYKAMGHIRTDWREVEIYDEDQGYREKYELVSDLLNSCDERESKLEVELVLECVPSEVRKCFSGLHTYILRSCVLLDGVICLVISSGIDISAFAKQTGGIVESIDGLSVMILKLSGEKNDYRFILIGHNRGVSVGSTLV